MERELLALVAARWHHREIPPPQRRSPMSASRSSTGRSRPTTRWASTTPGAAPTRTSTSATRPCAATSSATRTASTARGCGSRSRSRRSSASRPSATSRRTASPSSSSAARSACCKFAAHQTEQSHPARPVDGLGRLVLHDVGREQLHHLALPQDLPRARLDLPGPRRHALVPALRHRHLPAWRSRPRATRSVTHTSLYVRLPLLDRPNESLLVWTTTPWTLASNVAAAVHPDLTYVARRAGRRDLSIWPRTRWRSAARRRATRSCSTLHGRRTGRLALPRPVRRAARRSRASSTGSSPGPRSAPDEGTGIVHIAPGCGKEDFALSQGVTTCRSIAPLDENGVYVDGFDWLTGQYVARGRRSRSSTTCKREGPALPRAAVHATATRICWRCGTELVFRLVDEWYISMDELRAAR